MADQNISGDPNQPNSLPNTTNDRFDPLAGTNQDINNRTQSDASVSPNAPPIDDEIFKSVGSLSFNRSNYIKDNVLDNFLDVTYGMSLAMVDFKAVQNFPSTGAPNLNPAKDYIVFASTGESQTNPSAPTNYYNIQSLSFMNFLGHYPQNPMIAFIWDGHMSLFEPHGFSLREDIEAMRKQMNYDAVAPWHFTYRLEIWFSGWDPHTSQWVRNIPIPITNSLKVPSLVYYTVITTMQADISTTGTQYKLSLQTYAHKNLRSDALTMRMETQRTGDSGSSSSGQKAPQSTMVQFGEANGAPTFEDFLEILVKTLKQQVLKDTEGRLNFKYMIYAPKWLLKAKFDTNGEINAAHGVVTFDPSSGVNTYAAQDADILTIISKVMDNLPLVRKYALRRDDIPFAKPRVWYNVRTNIQYAGDFDKEINSYKTYTLEYFIEPVLSFRSGKTKTNERNKQVLYGSQLERAKAINDLYNMLLRVYDFMFTNDNSEVINFDLQFKWFYSEAYPTGSHSLPRIGQETTNVPYDTIRLDQQRAEAIQDQNSGGAVIDFTRDASQSTLAQAIGLGSSPQSADDLTPPSYKFGDLFRGPDLAPTRVMSNAEAQEDMDLYVRQKDQYYRFDMISSNMTVRFDPLWLINPYVAGGDYSPKTPDKASINWNMDRVIFVKAYAPVQSDFMNPLRQGGSSRKTPILGGFYQVLKVANIFESGKFYQNLNILKYPHLNGFLGPTTNDAGIRQGTTDTGGAPAAPNPTSGQADPATPRPLPTT